jgi:hypothetical protein
MPRIRQAPSDLDKRRFIQHAFDTVAEHFQQRLDTLRLQVSVEVDFQLESKGQFAAEVFVNGKSRRECRVWLENDRIAFSDGPAGLSDIKSFNEMLSLAPHELALAALMKMGWGKEGEGLDLDRLTPETAAEYLWRRFTSRLN